MMVVGSCERQELNNVIESAEVSNSVLQIIIVFVIMFISKFSISQRSVISILELCASYLFFKKFTNSY